MADVLAAGAVVGGIAAILAGLMWLASRSRRRGTAGAALAGAMAAYDEAMHSTAHDTYLEVQAQAERKVPVPSPDNG
jgi:hypothetical protein